MFDASPRPELLALLAAVKADPDDDTPRLVLADWLEEQDHEVDRARGEYLRLLMEYHRLTRNEQAGWNPYRRFTALWEQYHPVWLGALPAAGFQFWSGVLPAIPGLLTPIIDGTHLVARRARVLCGSEAYAWVSGLKFLRISSGQLSKFAKSPLLASLASLAFSQANVSESSLVELIQSQHADSIRSLRFERDPVPAVAIATSPTMQGLVQLTIDTGIDDTGFKALCNSAHLNRLRSLDVSHNRLTIHSARAFAEATGLPALCELNLGGLNRIGPDGALILTASPNAKRLRKLNLWANSIADYGVEAICNQQHICNLTHLDLAGNLLRNRAAAALAAAGHLATLEELSLRINEIEDEGAMALANSPYLANLRLLDLSGNRIGEKAAAALRERFGSRVTLD